MTEEQKQALIEEGNRILKHGYGTKKSDELIKIALAALTAQPIGRVDRGAATDSNEYPDARVVCLHEHVGWEAFQDGCELFTRPAPAINLDPVSNCLSFFASVIKSGESWSATCQRDLDAARRALRDAEEAK